MVIGTKRLASALAMILIWVVLPGCGGDGGSDPTTVSQPPTQGGPSLSPTPGGNLPPLTGPFGGEQGKILFAEGVNLPTSISELDLATRQVRVLVDYSQTSFNRVVGGVSRANDGTFAVVRGPGVRRIPLSFIIGPMGCSFIRGWCLVLMSCRAYRFFLLSLVLHPLRVEPCRRMASLLPM